MPFTLNLPIMFGSKKYNGYHIFYEDGLNGLKNIGDVEYIRTGIKSAQMLKTADGWDVPVPFDEVMKFLIDKKKYIVLNISGCRDGWNSYGLANGFPDMPGAMDSFVSIVTYLGMRYNYDRMYIEMWNEPDIPEGGGMYDWFGAIAIPSDEWAGGKRYADMVTRCYDELKQKGYTGKVMIGSLCGASQEELNPVSKFLEGFLREYPKFDALSFHFYGHYANTPDSQVARFLEIYNYHRDMLVKYSRPDSEIMCTETSYLRPDKYPDTDEFLDWQLQYISKLKFTSSFNKIPVMVYTYKNVNWRGCQLEKKKAAVVWST